MQRWLRRTVRCFRLRRWISPSISPPRSASTTGNHSSPSSSSLLAYDWLECTPMSNLTSILCYASLLMPSFVSGGIQKGILSPILIGEASLLWFLCHHRMLLDPCTWGTLCLLHSRLGSFVCVCVCVFFFSCPQCQCDSHISIDIFDIFRICWRPLVQFVSLESSPRDLNTHLLGINKLLCRLQSLLVQFSFYCTRI